MRVVLADDHPTILAGVDALLRSVPRVQIVATAGNGDALIQRLTSTACDIVVTDYAMPGSQSGDGLALLGFLRRRWPSLRLVLHTMQDSPAILARARQLGIRQMVGKGDASGHLAAALQAAMFDGDYFSPSIQRILQTASTGSALLSPREDEVVRLYVSGMTTTEIAVQLHRSKQTVSTQKRSAMRKLGVRHDAELVRAWLDQRAMSAGAGQAAG